MPKKSKTIKVQTTVNAPIKTVWEMWNNPEHIVNWAHASDDWEAPEAENDLRVGGRFKTAMRAVDKSESFDFMGTYSNVAEHEVIEYEIDDGRKVSVKFEGNDKKTKVTEIFEPENINSEKLQKEGWQAILDNFKNYVEENK
jgi:uncharacterized protein YndB with AHSA1/START domain